MLEPSDQLARGLNPELRVLFQELSHDLGQGGLHRRRELLQVGHGIFQVGAQKLLGIFPLVGRMARNELKERGAQGVEARADVGIAAMDLLGRSIGGELDDGRQGELFGGRGQEANGALPRHENAAGVNEEGPGGRAHLLSDLNGDLRRLVGRQSPFLLQITVQR